MENLAEALRQRGQRLTLQRSAIYRYLKGSKSYCP